MIALLIRSTFLSFYYYQFARRAGTAKTVRNTVTANLITVMQRMALVCVQKVLPDLVVIRVSFFNMKLYNYINVEVYRLMYTVTV